MSVTAVTFTARSVHSRAADPDTLHFRGPAAARARSMAIDILPAVACPSTATAPTQLDSSPWRHHNRLHSRCGVLFLWSFPLSTYLHPPSKLHTRVLVHTHHRAVAAPSHAPCPSVEQAHCAPRGSTATRVRFTDYSILFLAVCMYVCMQGL